MRIPFRQGLVRYQSDIAGTPVFLQPNGNEVNLIVSPVPTIVTFAHRETDYLFEENTTTIGAWEGPFISGTDYWLYWDINLNTAERTFGHTTLEPYVGTSQPPKLNGQHWFDTNKNYMKFWNGKTWQEVIRVFAGKYDNGSVIMPNPKGTQVGLSYAANSGYILFDDNEKVIRKFTRGRRSEFITTESVLITHLSSGAASFTFETALNFVQAVEPIPEYHLVSPRGVDQIGLASYIDTNRPIIGIVREDMSSGTYGSFTPQGYVTNEAWNWALSPGTPVFCGVSGQITSSVPQTGAIQQVGYVVSRQTIFIGIKEQIILGGA